MRFAADPPATLKGDDARQSATSTFHCLQAKMTKTHKNSKEAHTRHTSISETYLRRREPQERQQRQETKTTTTTTTATTATITHTRTPPVELSRRVAPLQLGCPPPPCGGNFLFLRARCPTQTQLSRPTTCGHHILDPGRPCNCLLYTSPSPRDATLSRMPSSA